MNTELLQKAIDWFVSAKVPGWEDGLTEVMLLIKEGKALKPPQKKFIALTLFGYAMHRGPKTFLPIEELAGELGITDELIYYTNNWINYPKTKSQVKPDPNQNN